MKEFLKSLNPRATIAVMLCATVCFVVITFVVAAVFYPPASVTETTRVKLFELLIYMLGIVSGFLIGKGADAPPPDQPKAP